MDVWVFLIPPLVLLGLIYWTTYRRLRRAAESEHPRVRLVLDSDPVEVGELRSILQFTGQKRTGIWRNYLMWHQRQLAALHQTAVIKAAAVGSAWWGMRRVRIVATAGWLPVLWLGLILAPLQTNVMESVASASSHLPHRIFAVVVQFEVIENDRGTVREEVLNRMDSLSSAPCGPLTRSTTALLWLPGNLMVHGTDFPRAYRRIHAVPLGLARSAVLLESHASDGSIDKALRGGAATFRFMPKTAELGLNLKVLLTQRDGQELDCKMIEPQK